MLILFACTALLVFASSLDLGWSNLLTNRRNDLVFEGRNHEYGAFALRREYHLNLFYALLLSIGSLGLLCWGLSHFGEVKASVPLAQTIALMDTSSFVIEEEEETQEEQNDPAPERAAPIVVPDENPEVEVVEELIVPKPLVVDLPVGLPGNPGPGSGLPGIGPSGDGGTGATTSGTSPAEPKIPDFVQHMPKFPGGDEALMAYVQSHVEYDQLSIERGIEGTIYVSFVVMADGHIGKVEVVRGLPNGKRLAESVISTIQSLPQWEPGMQNNQPVAVRKTIPVHFMLK